MSVVRSTKTHDSDPALQTSRAYCQGSYRAAKRSHTTPVTYVQQRWANPTVRGHRENPSPSVPTSHNRQIFINVMDVLRAKAWCPGRVRQGFLAKPGKGPKTLCLNGTKHSLQGGKGTKEEKLGRVLGRRRSMRRDQGHGARRRNERHLGLGAGAGLDLKAHPLVLSMTSATVDSQVVEGSMKFR